MADRSSRHDAGAPRRRFVPQWSDDGRRILLRHGPLEDGVFGWLDLATRRITDLTVPAVGLVDKTGLTGRYDYLLEFAPDSARAPGLVRLLSPETPLPAGDVNAPSLAAALQEQLGLKLESGRGQVQVVVVDKLEKPTPD